MNFVAMQPHVALATGTAIDPLSGLDTITGLDLDQFSKMSGGFHFLEGGPFTNDQDALVDEYYAKEKRLRVGDNVQLIGHEWRLAGIFESGKLARICVRLPVLQRLMGNEHHLSQIYVKADSPDHISGSAWRTTCEIYPGIPIYTIEEFTSLLLHQQRRVVEEFHRGCHRRSGHRWLHRGVHGDVYRSAGADQRDRHPESGWSFVRLFVLDLLFRETLLLSILGSLAGILLTYGTQWLMQHAVPSSLAQETVYLWWPIAGGLPSRRFAWGHCPRH